MTAAQAPPSPDSVVAQIIRLGPGAKWQPAHLYENCPDTKPWQRRAIDLLLTANLEPETAGHLALSWKFPLRTCSDVRLEHWYFKSFSEAVDRGDREGILLNYWTAFDYADTQAVRQFLWDFMLDANKPERKRSTATLALFQKFGRDERIREYLRAFETERLPTQAAWAQTAILLKQDPERLLREVGHRIRANPVLSAQTAFMTIVELASDYASDGARRALGEDLTAAAERAGLHAEHTTRLKQAASHLTAHAQETTPEPEEMIRGFADAIRNTGNYAQAGGNWVPRVMLQPWKFPQPTVEAVMDGLEALALNDPDRRVRTGATKFLTAAGDSGRFKMGGRPDAALIARLERLYWRSADHWVRHTIVENLPRQAGTDMALEFLAKIVQEPRGAEVDTSQEFAMSHVAALTLSRMGERGHSVLRRALARGNIRNDQTRAAVQHLVNSRSR